MKPIRLAVEVHCFRATAMGAGESFSRLAESGVRLGGRRAEAELGAKADSAGRKACRLPANPAHRKTSDRNETGEASTLPAGDLLCP